MLQVRIRVRHARFTRNLEATEELLDPFFSTQRLEFQFGFLMPDRLSRVDLQHIVVAEEDGAGCVERPGRTGFLFARLSAHNLGA